MLSALASIPVGDMKKTFTFLWITASNPMVFKHGDESSSGVMICSGYSEPL